MRDVIAYATAGHPQQERDRIIQMIQSPYTNGHSRRCTELAADAFALTTRQIADRLDISTKTADHHIQDIYNKIGVSTRAAALWATQHAVVG